MATKAPLKTTGVLNRRLLERLRLLPAEVYDSDGDCFFNHLTITKMDDKVYHCRYRDAAHGLDFSVMTYPTHGLVSRHDGGGVDVLALAKCYGLVEQYLPKRKDCRVCHN